ncbi:TonB-dependent receptor plug domain-containing protein [Terricaulis sp.]|uniref:TonB-dependent receptor plug domain-containing protein n=1 Tax=Terricaulis sp. TaxID=2768686 RepID=UPI0037841ED2
MTKKTNKTADSRKSLLTGASVIAAAAAAFAGTPAMAQDSADEEEAIVVTGTRLQRQDFEAISPVTTVGAEQLELTATLTTESLLNELPQIVPGNTRTSNNAGGEDFATVDLRGLGPNRTLVLVNGQRVPASSTTGVVDLNTIPASLISRIEVVTGGASAVYGSDAISGVINFILKDDYEGAETTLTYGAEMETGNAAQFEWNALLGGNFADGRGNLTVYGAYFNRNKVSQAEYDWSRVSGAIGYTGPGQYNVYDTSAEWNADNPVNVLSGGSGTPAWGWITNNPANPFSGLAAALPGQFAAANTDCNPGTAGVAVNGGDLSFNDAGQLTPRFVAAGCRVPDRAAGSSRYNFAPDNYIITPAERANISINGHYDITDDLRLNIMANFADSRTEVQLAPTPATGLRVTLTPAMRTLIQTNAPDLWTALQTRPTGGPTVGPYQPFTIDRRMNEVGTRNGLFENESYYFLASLQGSLGENWDWELAGSYGQSNFLGRGLNSVNATALSQGLAGCQALGAGPDGILNTQDDTGTALGGVALPGCVPLDIFGPGTLTPAMQSFLRVNTFSQTIVEESRVTGFVRGDLFELPAGPVASVFGFEYRDTYGSFSVDNEQRTGNIFGFNATQDQRGQIDVYELYTELAIPLVADQPFAHYLGIEAGYRRSNYSSVGDVDTYKIGAEWAPTEWLRFRAMFNESTRAPSVFELFQNGDQGFPAYVDRCNDVNSDGTPDNAAVTAAECLAQSPAWASGFNQNNTQVQAFAFGQPDLAPETAESTTYGFVFQPDWFPVGDFRATVDYYHIEIQDIIAAFTAQFYIDACLLNTPADAAACARITRDPVTAQITSVATGRGNQGVFDTKGIDFQFEWSVPVGPGQLTINELYTLIDSLDFNGTEFAGTSAGAIGTSTPEYKSVLSVTYNVGDWTLFGRWSYTPETTSATFTGPPLPSTSPAASYVDASVRWNVTDNFTLTGVVDNLFDETPPQTADGVFGGQGNTDPQMYRVLGRSFSVSARFRF